MSLPKMNLPKPKHFNEETIKQAVRNVNKEKQTVLERDADRYRWIRKHWFQFGMIHNELSDFGYARRSMAMAGDLETLDAAIDAAIAKEKK